MGKSGGNNRTLGPEQTQVRTREETNKPNKCCVPTHPPVDACGKFLKFCELPHLPFSLLQRRKEMVQADVNHLLMSNCRGACKGPDFELKTRTWEIKLAVVTFMWNRKHTRTRITESGLSRRHEKSEPSSWTPSGSQPTRRSQREGSKQLVQLLVHRLLFNIQLGLRTFRETTHEHHTHGEQKRKFRCIRTQTCTFK